MIYHLYLVGILTLFLPSFSSSCHNMPTRRSIIFIVSFIFWWGPLILMPDPRSYLPSLVPVIAFHTNQLVNIISRLVRCVLTQFFPKYCWWVLVEWKGINFEPKLFGTLHVHLIIFSFVRTFSRLVQLIAYLCTFCTSSWLAQKLAYLSQLCMSNPLKTTLLWRCKWSHLQRLVFTH